MHCTVKVVLGNPRLQRCAFLFFLLYLTSAQHRPWCGVVHPIIFVRPRGGSTLRRFCSAAHFLVVHRGLLCMSLTSVPNFSFLNQLRSAHLRGFPATCFFIFTRQRMPGWGFFSFQFVQHFSHPQYFLS